MPQKGNLIKFRKTNTLVGNIRPYLKKIWYASIDGGTNGDVLVFQKNVNVELNPRYLYHILASDKFFEYISSSAKGAKMPRGDKKSVMNYEVAIPPVEVQQLIVEVLDKFDKLVNDLTEGLPAEIEARKKQYEYFRDTLLNFKEIDIEE